MDTYISKADLRIDPHNISHEKVDDKYLETLQNLTYALVNSFCNQDFELEGTSEAPVEYKVDGKGKDTIFLPKRIVSLDKVRLYSAINSYDEYDAENFVVKPKYIQFNSLGDITHPRVIGSYYIFPDGVANIGVTGTWGWSLHPDAIKYLQGRLIVKLIDDKSFANQFEAEKVGDYSYQIRRKTERGEEITGDFELDAIIKQYRDWLSYGTN